VEWLPPYAPELNDIERDWRHLKCHYLAHQTFISQVSRMSMNCWIVRWPRGGACTRGRGRSHQLSRRSTTFARLEKPVLSQPEAAPFPPLSGFPGLRASNKTLARLRRVCPVDPARRVPPPVRRYGLPGFRS
jgi:hypothetical protein